MQRDKDQVRRIIDIALEVSMDKDVPIVDRVTRLRAARCFAEEAGLDVWLAEIDKRIVSMV